MKLKISKECPRMATTIRRGILAIIAANSRFYEEHHSGIFSILKILFFLFRIVTKVSKEISGLFQPTVFFEDKRPHSFQNNRRGKWLLIYIALFILIF